MPWYETDAFLKENLFSFMAEAFDVTAQCAHHFNTSKGKNDAVASGDSSLAFDFGSLSSSHGSVGHGDLGQRKS